MKEKRPLGVSLIGGFYIFGASILIITLILGSPIGEYGIADRLGLPNVPENIARLVIALLSLIMAYGYLKLERWGYWTMMLYSLYFLVVSIVLSIQYNQQPFYGNIIWSIIVILYTFIKRKNFDFSKVLT